MNVITVCRRACLQLLRSFYQTPTWTAACRLQSFSTGSESPPQMTPGESKITEVLKQKFPKATDIRVLEAMPGSCGSMYQVYVEAPDFKGKRIVQQHRMVTEALEQEIADMHGLTIQTALSPNS
ncbi:bolA-like protein 3 [Lingula anatina]|uniref:BolA-like protein 3 n=1 Tax=Lingula anatina TaxID=7574 RepID=A0A1S3HHA4_LINAN|nr:bolA-like protein 3 [Lingula anatina]|eukprot:XP_013385455.1 bolA-like protein 3 [Lingula anatina]